MENEVEVVVEAAQDLANVSEQAVAIYLTTDGRLAYDVKTAIIAYTRILEVLHPVDTCKVKFVF